MTILIHWLLDALAVLLVAKIVPGVKVRTFGTALVVALVLGVLGIVLGPILKAIGAIVAFPLVFLGLFFVIRFLVNTFLLWLTDKLVDGLKIDGAGPLFVASAIMTILHAVILKIVG